MPCSDDKYIKANDYNTKAQKHNHSIFVSKMRRHAWLAFLIGFSLDILEASMFLNPSFSNILKKPYELIVISFLLLSLSVYFLWIAATSDSQQDKNTKTDVTDLEIN